MKLAIVMPVVLQNHAMWTTTREAVACLQTEHEASLYVICNRLHVCVPQALCLDLQTLFAGRVFVVHEPGVERSVAGAWNEGCKLAFAAGADYVAVVANDTLLSGDCLDRLAEYGARTQAALWSGISCTDRSETDESRVTDGGDFSAFMIRSRTIAEHGQFDPNLRPACFEDNDYCGRVVLGGGECHGVHSARLFHHGSMTVRQDPEMAHHVSYWFERNRACFRSKWGVDEPAGSREGVLASGRHPIPVSKVGAQESTLASPTGR